MKREIEKSGATSDTRRSVSDAVDAFWDARTGSERRHKTFEHDRWMLDIILDGLGSKRVATLTVKDCDEFLKQIASGQTRRNGATRKPLVRTHVSRTRGMLIRVLDNERRLGFQIRNVAELSAMPATPATSREHLILTPDQLSALLEAAEGALAVFIDLCGRNGLRPQEARAIEWPKVDWSASTLDVGPQMNRQGIIVGPKTPRAPRTIALSDATLTNLEEWRHAQSHARKRAGELWVDTYDLVITTSIGTTIQGKNVVRSIRKLAKKVGISPTIIAYDLRHTAITLQSKHGYSDWELADWAGTSERMINEIYRHRTDKVVGVRPLDL